ncbi:hypothetical protein F5Y05DRAFT_421981 [Hypoxylon sp. FL0543]|nr:hypothetical protein F5Y05DRAFT_421981 [Hypoxylon sp. FL0543]
MCLEVYIHTTCREHDTRRPSVVNPATGYTVYSPFQEPSPNPRCEYPHVYELIPPDLHCPYHPGCCKLEGKVVCQFEGDTCRTRVKYHHFVDKENGETDDLSFLDAYLCINPSLVFIAAWFFKAGVQLAEADLRRNKLLDRLSSVDGDNNKNQRQKLERRLAHLSSAVALSRESVGQFAVIWDLNTGPKALPPRPGWHPDPEQNAGLSNDLRLKVQGWRRRDADEIEWPRLVNLREGFRAGLLPIYDDPSIVCWGFRTKDQAASSFPSSTYISAPAEQVDCVHFNTGTPIVYLEPKTPEAASYASSYVLPSPSPRPDIFKHDSDHESNHSASDADESSEQEEDSNKLYPIEAIVGHGPPSAPSLKRLKMLKVRWSGDWPPDQKETWQMKDDIPPDIVANYWQQVKAKKRETSHTPKRRRTRRRRGR